MVIQEALRIIDETGGYQPFKITFTKADGTIRDMIAVKRNKHRASNGQAKPGTAFKYSLTDKGSILVNELIQFKPSTVSTSYGTHHQLGPIDIESIRIEGMSTKPVTIKKYSVKFFNDIPVEHE